MSFQQGDYKGSASMWGEPSV